MIKTNIGKLIVTLIGTTAAIISLALAQSSYGQDKTPAARERIGIYDSRAVTVAYVGSTAQVKRMKELTAQLNKAREAGDTNQIARLETEGRSWQSNLKQQGFGTAPVDDLLAHVTNDLPSIREAAGVTSLISKWNKTELDKHPRAERIDVTMALVNAFQPNESQRKRSIEIQKTKPEKNPE